MISAEKKWDKLIDYPSVKDNEDGLDARGYEFLTDNNIILGKIKSLIIADNSDLIRYLEVNTEKYLDNPNNMSNPLRNDKKYADRFNTGYNLMLIPVGLAEINTESEKVKIYGLKKPEFMMVWDIKPQLWSIEDTNSMLLTVMWSIRIMNFFWNMPRIYWKGVLNLTSICIKGIALNREEKEKESWTLQCCN